MKSVLISIQPKWCEKIASGEKTVEVRKTRPNIETPFKCYIYETKALYKPSGSNHLFNGDGKVIGEFVCDEIIVAECGSYFKISLKDAQLDALDLMEYADGKTVYGWHISELVIYNDPKELREFKGLRKTKFGYAPYEIVRPPQSWFYVDHPTEKGGAE